MNIQCVKFFINSLCEYQEHTEINTFIASINYFMKKLIVICGLFLFISACKSDKNSNATIKKKPEVQVLNYSELEPILNKDDNTTYVVNFWATWCAPCVKELPHFEEALAHYKNDNVKIILVSLDFPNHLEDKLIPFIEKNKLKSEVILLDDPAENTWIPAIDDSWSGALPATLIYNKNKRAFYEQSFTKEELFNEINKFI